MSVPASREHARVAVVGSGPLADEVVRNLGLVGVAVVVHVWAISSLAFFVAAYREMGWSTLSWTEDGYLSFSP